MLYAAGVTWILYKLVDALIGMRVTEKEENIGLDLTQHSEAAYTVIE
jgi:Amt family ammonium transporter